mmetsp:Transcript_3713/g.8708  ORF Transcript_3713/g.8708 Transcript_3713/m.8708 type:complete len:201 (+) Transcript_3713:807-1409(+)
MKFRATIAAFLLSYSAKVKVASGPTGLAIRILPNWANSASNSSIVTPRIPPIKRRRVPLRGGAGITPTAGSPWSRSFLTSSLSLALLKATCHTVLFLSLPSSISGGSPHIPAIQASTSPTSDKSSGRLRKMRYLWSGAAGADVCWKSNSCSSKLCASLQLDLGSSGTTKLGACRRVPAGRDGNLYGKLLRPPVPFPLGHS